MRYHDYHLKKYEVTDHGKSVILYLTYDYPDVEKAQSVISFKEVALYNFLHTSGAIITDIEEEPIGQFMKEIEDDVTEWHRMLVVEHWQSGFEEYVASLAEAGFRAWRVESAIGFYGFVIAKEVQNA